MIANTCVLDGLGVHTCLEGIITEYWHGRYDSERDAREQAEQREAHWHDLCATAMQAREQAERDRDVNTQRIGTLHAELVAAERDRAEAVNWAHNEKSRAEGAQTRAELSERERDEARSLWREVAEEAAKEARELQIERGLRTAAERELDNFRVNHWHCTLEDRAASLAEWDKHEARMVAAERRAADALEALRRVGDLLFGTWEVPPDPTFEMRLREAEGICRALLAGSQAAREGEGAR